MNESITELANTKGLENYELKKNPTKKSSKRYIYMSA